MDKGDYIFVAQTLHRMGLDEGGAIESVQSLSGGVSCDVWRVQLRSGRDLVVKRALPALRVTADWRAPVERSDTEVAWIQQVAKLNPLWVPEVAGQDRTGHAFAMAYLPSETNPVWKSELAGGKTSAGFAAQVGSALADIHGASAGSEALADQFARNEQFMALRLEPYLLFTAARHADFAGRITALANGVARSRIALMQGDISPKNILCGPSGPVFLDAETACYGDPAFDLAFCLNHLLLKSVWHPEYREGYAASFRALKNAYLNSVDWEDADDIDARTAALLPALLLARIDGKSPVEYLTSEPERHFVREHAKALLRRDDLRLEEILESWVRQPYFAGSR